MNNQLMQLLDNDENMVLNVLGNNRDIVRYMVENLAIPILPVDPAVLERRVPIRNENYVEVTVPLYTPDEFKSHFRMPRASMEDLIIEIGNRLRPKRESQMSVEKKVLFTVWILAKPETFLACSDRFGIAQSTGHFVYREIINILSDMVADFVRWPNIRQCQENTMIFQERSRGIPNVIGAIDGSHIFIKQPVGNAVDYFNRYQSHSVILQAVCDPSKVFINISVGHPGRMHDARVFRRSSLYARIINEDEPLIRPEYHIIGDAAYPLLQEVLTPYRDTGHLTEMQTRYNVRFSRIRSVIERAFALLKGKWRRLKYLDMSDMNLLNKVITATCVLHNIVIQQGDEDEEIEILDDEGDVPQVRFNERRRHHLGQIKRTEISNNLM